MSLLVVISCGKFSSPVLFSGSPPWLLRCIGSLSQRELLVCLLEFQQVRVFCTF